MKPLDLGIKKELVAKAGIPIDPPLPIDKPTTFFKAHVFPIAVLEKVEFVPEFETKDKQTEEVTKQPILRFIYKDTKNSEKKITDIIYPIDMAGDDKAQIKLDGLQKSIKHIFEELVGSDKFVEEEFAGTSFAELFENVANAFNKYTTTKTIKVEGADTPIVVPLYTLMPFYLKLVFFNGRLTPTMFPNFVQKAYNKTGVQIPCELSVGKKDTIVNKTDAKPAGNAGGLRDNGFGGAGAGVFGMDSGAAGDMVFPE